MQIFKSKHNGSDFCQIYATKDELQNEEIQEKINNIKKSESKVAMFVSGDDEYLKIIERIIMLEVEKRNVLWYNSSNI